MTLLNTKFKHKLALLIRHIESLGQSIVKVTNCSFSTSGEYEPLPEHYQSQQNDDGLLYNHNRNNTSDFWCGCNDYTEELEVILHYDSVMVYSYFLNYNEHTKTSKIKFIKCSFLNINNSETRKLLEFSQMYTNDDVEYLEISIINCLFHNNYYVKPISIVSYNNQFQNHHVSVLIKNVTVSSNINGYIDAITANMVALYIENVNFTLNIFNDLNSDIGTIITAINSYVQFSGYNEFSYNNAFLAISTSALYIQENTILNFTLNAFYTFIYNDQPAIDDIDMCIIQYISERGILDNEFQQGKKLNYSMVLIKNRVKSTELLCHYLMHCAWDSSSVFIRSYPLQVNQRFITSDNFVIEERKQLVCLCDKSGTQHCHKGNLGLHYPGQTVSLYFSLDYDHTITDAIRIEIRTGYSSYICDNDKLKLLQLQLHECKPLEYTIKHNGKWCEVILTVTPLQIFPGFDKPLTQRYTILLQLCPKGFSLHPQGYCQCDPILSSHIPSLTTCDIDYQTIPRPANTWISAHTINNSHSYHVSLHCPFDYCLPHSSQLNLSTPDSQCQFNRSGVLCGQCQHGLSTVFGSSQCKNCSNIYMLIIIPLGIAGLVLVLLLFTLNITVTNGDINPFLLYINTISINAPIFFPTGESVMYTFVSLANLDLGIETCFYIGMNDYAKMWLQLVFPIYITHHNKPILHYNTETHCT